MVLSDALTDQPTSFSDDSSLPSDSDHYASDPNSSSSSSYPTSTTLDLRTLPGPLPLIGPLFGYSRSHLGLVIQQRVPEFSRLVKRPLKQDEIAGVAYHIARQQQIMSYGHPLATALGFWRAERTKDTYRFPFYKPDLEKFNPEKLGPLTGSAARAGWHALRRLCFMGMGWAVGGVVFGSISANVAASGTYMDPRMKEVVEAVKKFGEEMRDPEKRRQAAAQRAGTGMAAGVGAGTSAGVGSSSQRSDSMSTVGGYGQGQGQMGGQAPSPYGNTSTQTYPTASSESTSSSSSSPFDLTSSAFPDDSNNNTTSSSPSQNSPGFEPSAWERLRRGQSPPPLSPSSSTSSFPPSSSPSPLPRTDQWASHRRADALNQERDAGDRFSFPSQGQDDDRQRTREKDQAQREFDEKVERERRGENFDDESRRWR